MPLILGTNSIKDTAYDVANSCRFNGAINNDETLIKTFGTATNRKKFTLSVWIKLCGRGQGNNNGILVAGTTGNDEGTIKIANDDISWTEYDADTSSVIGNLQSNAMLRDYSAWSHLVFRWDSTDSTAGDRMQIYHNGTRVTSFSATTNPSVNYDACINNNVVHNVGRQSWNGSGDFNGYMAEMFFIDGTALNADSFGEFDSASPTIWKPKDCKDDFTFGNNGFYLEFKQSGTGTNSSGIGADTSGNDNHFAVNNLTSLSQSTDTCTNNFATMNSLNFGAASSGEFLNGNLDVHMGGTAQGVYYSTIGVTTGKWVVEVNPDSGSGGNSYIGISGMLNNQRGANDLLGDLAFDYGYYQSDGSIRNNDSDSSYGSSYSNGNIIGVYLDLDNNKLYFSVNGTVQNSGTGISISDVSNTPSGFYFFCVGDDNAFAERRFNLNFGSPIESISSGNTDGEYGNFEYTTTITGDGASKTFRALCTKNLAEYG